MQLDKLTTLNLTGNAESTRDILQATKSSESLEELSIYSGDADGKELTIVFPRFINLKQLSYEFYRVGIEDNLLDDFHRLKGLRLLSIAGDLQITADLQQLVLRFLYSAKYLKLKESTYNVYLLETKKFWVTIQL